MDGWAINFTARAAKQYAKLGHAVQEQVTDLLRDISIGGQFVLTGPTTRSLARTSTTAM